jgi:lipopolysaccharide/colanic/teichoic acid biosynthesis glycosyltransferase
LVREIAPTSFADLQLVDDSTSEFTPRERSETLGRAVNVVVAAVAMVLLFPLMVLVAIAIKLTSSGPVFYSQTRVGLDRRNRRRGQDERRSYDHGGKLFKMYKFRTMPWTPKSMDVLCGRRRVTRALRRSVASYDGLVSTNCRSSTTCSAAK